jgi:ABC-type polysaccharide/polyol phosphate export permease
MLKEILSKKDLVRELVLKNLKVRYSGSSLGFFWVLLSPLLVVLIFYLVFSLFLRVTTEEAPFILYLMSGIFTWRFFQDSLLACTTSLPENKNLIREASLPHYLLPLSLILVNAVEFFPSLLILLIASFLLLQGLPSWLWLLPFALLTHLGIIIGLSVIFSVLYVRWRDIKYILDVFLLLFFYLTPAFYSIFLVKKSFPPFLFKLYLFNPLVCVLSLYRISLLKGFYPAVRGELPLLWVSLISLASALATLGFAFYYYRRSKNKINDYLSY